MQTLRYCFLFLLLSGLALPCLAADDALFVAEARVADEGSDTRNAALAGLLGDVLVRVSGNTGIAAQPAAKPVLAAAPSLAQQYRYRTADEDGATVRYLWARFDRPAVERMMREHGLPVWSQRPRVLVWLATEEAGKRSLLNLETHLEARDAALVRARARGMPLQFPLMDLEDQAQLTPADLWSDFEPAIRQASARYPHDLVVNGRLRAASGDRWTGRWSMRDRDGSQAFETPALNLPEALAFAVDQVQNLLAARFAPVPGAGSGDGTLVRFSDIHDLAAYGRLVALLETLEPVSQVALRHADDDAFTFEFSLRGSVGDLRRALDSAAMLTAEPGRMPARLPPRTPDSGATGAPVAAMAPAPEADLFYRLLN